LRLTGRRGNFTAYLTLSLLAPYLRRYGEYTIPDFLSARYGGNAIRLLPPLNMKTSEIEDLAARLIKLITSQLA